MSAAEIAEDELRSHIAYGDELDYTQVNPILDGAQLGKDLNDSVVIETPPGSDGELVVSDEATTSAGLVSSTPGDIEIVDTDDSTITHGMCLPVAGNHAAAGTSDGYDEPESNTGYVVNAEVTSNNAGADREVRGWRFDH